MMEDRDKIQFRIVYVLDADTLELMSITDYDTLPDGSEVKAYKQTIYFCDDFKENAENISVCKPWKPDADVSAFGYLHDRQTPCLLIPGL